MESEAISSASEPAALAEVLGAMIGRDARAHMDESQRAAAAWAMANGDAERAHTGRVWLEESPRARVAPVLVVEVDSHPLLSDFNAKRELYLGRLATYGLVVSGIRFRFAAMPRRWEPGRADRQGNGAVSSRRGLTADERARVDELMALLDVASLRGPVERAITASLRASAG